MGWARFRAVGMLRSRASFKRDAEVELLSRLSNVFASQEVQAMDLHKVPGRP